MEKEIQVLRIWCLLLSKMLCEEGHIFFEKCQIKWSGHGKVLTWKT